MVTGQNVADKIRHYSNPSVSYTHPENNVGEPTGNAGHNNAAEVDTYFCEIATYELAGAFRAGISSGVSPKDCHKFTLNSNVFASSTGGPGSGPFTYQWRQSATPNYASATVFATSTSTQITVPSNNTHYVWLDVMASDGQSVRTAAALSPVCSSGTPDPLRTRMPKGADAQAFAIRLQPNGTSLIELSRVHSSQGSLRVQLVNALGNVVSDRSYVGGGEFLIEDHLTSGFYTVTVFDDANEAIASTKIVVQ